MSSSINSTFRVSTHSRPKAAGEFVQFDKFDVPVSTHSRPKAAGAVSKDGETVAEFQHTAARRRLVLLRRNMISNQKRFNTQPPEGGWVIPFPNG